MWSDVFVVWRVCALTCLWSDVYGGFGDALAKGFWDIPLISQKYTSNISKIICIYPQNISKPSPISSKNHQQSSTKSSKIVQKTTPHLQILKGGGCGGSRIPGYGKWGQPDPRAGGPPLLRICRWFVVFEMFFEDSLTIVDDFVRILERVLRYFGDISRLYQVVPEPTSKLHFLSRSSRPKLKISCFFRETIFENTIFQKSSGPISRAAQRSTW